MTETDIVSQTESSNSSGLQQTALVENTNSKLSLRKLAAGCAIALSTLSLALGNANKADAGNVASSTPDVPYCDVPIDTPRAAYDAKRDVLKVKGNHVVNGFGRKWVPEGISIFGGLQDGDHTANWINTIGSSMAQIKAAPYWHANNVRIQWSEANIFNDVTPGHSVNVPFLMALCQQVRQVRAQGEVAVLNDQTEFPDWSEFNPMKRTESAWEVVIKEFGNQPGIIADLFNEPRLTLSAAGKKNNPANTDWLWKVWRNGGEVGGKQFIGMQALINFTRAQGFKGVEWIEPPMLQGLVLAGKFAVKDPAHNFEWSFHHPPEPPSTGNGDTAAWDQSFGYLTSKYAVVDGEFNQAAAPTSECSPYAYKVVPNYLRYAKRKGIGIDIWSLQEGSMVAEPKGQHKIATNITAPYDPTNPDALKRPSHMSSDYACDKRHEGTGIGFWMLRYFRDNSHS